MLEHGEAKVLIADRELGDVINEAVGMLDNPPQVIDVNDPEFSGAGTQVSDLDYENAMGNQAVWSMGMHPVYLWTLPMFHCNGWCFPWTITAMAGTHVCLRRVDPEKILQ